MTYQQRNIASYHLRHRFSNLSTWLLPSVDNLSLHRKMGFPQLKIIHYLACLLLGNALLTGALRIGTSRVVRSAKINVITRQSGTVGLCLDSDLRLGSPRQKVSPSRLLSSPSSTGGVAGRYDELTNKLQSYLSDLYAVSENLMFFRPSSKICVAHRHSIRFFNPLI